MTRTFSFLFMFLFLASCGKGGGGGSAGAPGNMAELSDADLTSTTVPVQAQTFDIQAEMSGFERDHEEKVLKAFDLIKKVVASDEFKQKILSKKFKGKKQFNENQGLTNAQIYKKILEASEKVSPGNNNIMDLDLECYYANENVIGYTKPSIQTVYMNRKYLNKSSFKANKVAMNLTHEWLHKLGFKHSQNRTATRPDTVPYAIGYIMRDLAAKID